MSCIRIGWNYMKDLMLMIIRLNWGFGVLGFWGFGVLGFWGFGVLGF